MNPLTRIKPSWRFGMYCVLFALDVIVGGAEIGYDTAELAYPLWLKISHADLKYLTAAGFLTALSNVPPSEIDAGKVDSE